MTCKYKNIKTLITHRELSLLIFSIAILLIFFILPLVFNSSSILNNSEVKISQIQNDNLKEIVIPTAGVVIPMVWGDLGKQMLESGIIDQDKFESLYLQRGGLNKEEQKILSGLKNGELKMDSQNAGFLLNLFWAFGIANKNPILEEGPMQDPRYGGADRFASTGGWTLSKGDVMNHYSKHSFVVLNKEQQNLLERVSKNIYRPCCGNSTYFPDCNHGMAMLGLLEIMASQGANETEMYKAALSVNSYWFPGTYLNIAQYFTSQGVSWEEVSAQKALGYDYSSSQGYQNILSKIKPQKIENGGDCGI